MNVKDPEIRKSSFIGFRAKEEERVSIEIEAEKLGVSLSEFIRLAVSQFITTKPVGGKQ